MLATTYSKHSLVQEKQCKGEKEALQDTIVQGTTEATGKWRRRLINFALVDAQGQPVALQKAGLQDSGELLLTGAPANQPMQFRKSRVMDVP